MLTNSHNVLQNMVQWLQMSVMQTMNVAGAHVCCSTLLLHHPRSKAACSATQQEVTAATAVAKEIKMHACMQRIAMPRCQRVQHR